ncbi:MAG: putative oxidoreductase protein [Alphaproteobacteria bacterium]|nr:putative oxidoreductase protein [Alphaproteobacteria bacterium]
MNVGDERSRSCWMDEAPVIDAPRLAQDESCDVVVIGAGIAGLSVAYELSRLGRSVVVIDRGGIGNGMTARTTAHLATELDDFYSELIRVRGRDEARLYYDSQVAAVNRIEAICRDEGIHADFARLDGYLFPAEESHLSDLREELDACRDIGVDCEWVDSFSLPGRDVGPAIRFPNQGRFHPTRYLKGLAKAILARGGRIYADSVHVSDEETETGVEITTEAGPVIRAGAAVFCTNSPTNAKVAIHPKQTPDRTYAIAGRVAKGSVPDALMWDTLEAYHYVRIQPWSDGADLLIVGGEDHRSGEASDFDARFEHLEAWTRERYPSFQGADYRWSGQVLETIDFMPFSGRLGGTSNIYIHTGDSGQGITNAVAGSLTIAPLILGEDSRFAPLLDPGRKSLTATASIQEFVREQAGSAKNMMEHVTPAEISSADELAPGEGGLIRRGLKKVAVYKGQDGAVIERSALCTHLGCVVHWNGFEKCWDCPCHGSQFAPDGQVLNGPAVKPLAEVEE